MKVSSNLVDDWIRTEKEEILSRVAHKGTKGEPGLLFSALLMNYVHFLTGVIKKSLWSSVVRRQFLLQLKAKYSGASVNIAVMCCDIL